MKAAAVPDDDDDGHFYCGPVWSAPDAWFSASMALHWIVLIVLWQVFRSESLAKEKLEQSGWKRADLVGCPRKKQELTFLSVHKKENFEPVHEKERNFDNRGALLQQLNQH